ncbi:MAG: YIP1 family protein [Anaerolineaceae bacterium]|nr:YIP1 family protein [Anaerolineaceae bacterium]
MENQDFQSSKKTRSPYLSIWIHPRETIRHILETNPDNHVLLFAMILGVLKAFDVASDNYIGDTLPFLGTIMLCIVSGMIIGPIRLYIYALLYHWVGTLFGGIGNQKEIRTAYVWSSMPTMFTLPIWILLLFIYGEELFMEYSPNLESHPLLFLLSLPLFVIIVILSIWSFILLILNLSEVQQFSIWRALATYFLPFLVLLIPTMIFFLILKPIF